MNRKPDLPYSAPDAQAFFGAGAPQPPAADPPGLDSSAFDAAGLDPAGPGTTMPQPPGPAGPQPPVTARRWRRRVAGPATGPGAVPQPSDANRWRLDLGPLSFERHTQRPAGYSRRDSRRSRSVKGRLIRYGLLAVALLIAVQALGSQFSWLHLPHISLSSPIGPTQTSITNIGPVIRNRLEGIPNPAPAQANYSFNFQLQKTRRIFWIWSVGYADTYYVSGEGYARVLLNPGGNYWKRHPNAFDLTVDRSPATAANGSVRPGQIVLVVTLPQPNLPRNTGDVRLDPVSGPVPGAARYIGCLLHVACGAAELAHVYFTPQVEQVIAFQKLSCVAGRDRALAATARQEAYSTIYGWLDKFSQALHYNLQLSIKWVMQGSDEAQPLPKYCAAVSGSTVTVP